MENTQENEYSQEFNSKLAALKAITTCHSLLQDANLPFNAHQAIASSLSFLQSLHGQVMAEALEMPEAKIHPDLSKLLNQPTHANN